MRVRWDLRPDRAEGAIRRRAGASARFACKSKQRRHPGSASEAQQVPAFPLTGGCRVSDRGLRQNPAAGRDSSWGVKRKMLALSQQFFVARRGIERFPIISLKFPLIHDYKHVKWRLERPSRY